jgi:mono/diheme cytochrome c family protein
MQMSMVKGVVVGLSLLGVAFAMASPAVAQDRIERGAYLAAVMDCSGCHTTGALLGKPDPQRHLAGSEVGFHIPQLGIFYPPNLTPDPETGLGKWSEADIIKAVRTGERPDGRVLAPVMPYRSYSRLSDADAQDLAAYLKSLKPIRHQAPAMVGATEEATAPYLTVVMPD